MRTMCSREIFTKKCRQQQILDTDLKGAWHYNHVTFTPIAKNFMLYCRLIYMLSILCVRLTTKVKVGMPESFKVGWHPPKKLGRVTLNLFFFFFFYVLVAVASLDFKVPIIGLPNGLGLWIFCKCVENGYSRRTGGL